MKIEYLIAKEIENTEGFRSPHESPEDITFEIAGQVNTTLKQLGVLGWMLVTTDQERWIFQRHY